MRSLKAAESMTPDTNILEVEISLPDASLVTCQQTFFWILHDEEGPLHLHEHLLDQNKCQQRHLLHDQVDEGPLGSSPSSLTTT